MKPPGKAFDAHNASQRGSTRLVYDRLGLVQLSKDGFAQTVATASARRNRYKKTRARYTSATLIT